MPLNSKDPKISSADFEPLGPLRNQHAGDKRNMLPRLTMSGVPAEAKQLDMTCHNATDGLRHSDGHDRPFGRRSEVPHGISAVDKHYYGPQSQSWHGRHLDYFWVCVLDAKFEGTPTRDRFLERYAGNTLKQNRFVGTFQKW